jgi:hypothetical protein
MKLYLSSFATIFLFACWSDAPIKPHRDAGPDAVTDAPASVGDDEDTLDLGRERGRAGGLIDAADEEAPSPPVGTGALCGVNGRDDCGPFQVCDAILGCVACARDDDCTLASPRCVGGACVECADAGDCPASAPSCWPKDHACHPTCTASCPPDAKLCVSGACWGCRDDADCPGARCSPTTRQCVSCLDDGDCTTGTPRCDVRTALCVACSSNDDCGRAAPVCDPATRACRVGCTSDAQCPGKRCDPATAECVDEPADSGPAPSDAGKD